MNTTELSTIPNLRLAWRRITTGGNYRYKKFFRELYCVYEVALEDNLSDLRQRLLGGAYQPNRPERIYLPKSSGLHRPLALLRIEDQIVLQAFANLAAKKLQKRRTSLQFRVVFSNLLYQPNSIFFFRRWQLTYGAFQRTIRKYYNAGLRWVADFDMAAFYDTISHDLLLKTIYPRSHGSGTDLFLQCLQTWSSDRTSSGHGHGIPQGPLGSDFLAECFLLPVDVAMRRSGAYLRYVDDVRLLAKSENELRKSILSLERECRERGLIPQAGKFAIKFARNVEEATAMLPSIADPQHELESAPLPKEQARILFHSAINGKPYRVKDKTRLRFVLYRAEPDSKLLKLVLRLLPHHPEESDAFFAFIGRFGYRKPVERLCLKLVNQNPYPYVRGEAWHVLARFHQISAKLSKTMVTSLTKKAIEIAKQQSAGHMVEKWGALHFLCVKDQVKGSRYSNFLTYQSPLLQCLLAPALPLMAFEPRGVAGRYLRRSSFEPGLSICSRLHDLAIEPTHFRLKPRELPSQVQNTLRELGIIASPGGPVDPIAEILERRYALAQTRSWKTLLASDYVHALGLLKQAEAAFSSGMSFWLACQNSFNHAIFIALQRRLNANGHSGACKFVNRNDQLLDFGVMLDSSGSFSRRYPNIADCFRNMNARRNHLPVAHPYDKKTGVRTKYLKVQERNRFVGQLRTAYEGFTKLMP